MTVNRFLLIAVVGLSVALTGCTAPDNGGDDSDSGTLVKMVDPNKFDPVEVTISVGEEVVWRNTGNIGHTVTSDDEDGPLDSGMVRAGGIYRYTFTEPGVYEYHCEPHAFQNDDGDYEGMIGTITVLDADGNLPDADDDGGAGTDGGNETA